MTKLIQILFIVDAVDDTTYLRHGVTCEVCRNLQFSIKTDKSKKFTQPTQ